MSSKSLFFRFGAEIQVLELQFLLPFARSSMVFSNSFSADRSGVAGINASFCCGCTRSQFFFAAERR